MTSRTLFFVLPLLSAACFAKTTSLGSVDADAGPAGLDGGGVTATADAAATPTTSDMDAGASDATCQIGASPALPCPTGEYCKADPGATCSSGRCTKTPPPPPPACPAMECGCDGVVRCADHSRSLGVDVGAGHCGVPCGPKACDGVTEYCLHGTGGIMTPDGGASTVWMCQLLPTACETNRSCACMQTAGISGSCTEKDGKLDVDTPLP